MMITIVIGKVSPRVRSQSPAQQHLFRRNVSDFELGKSSLEKVAADIQLGEMNLRKVWSIYLLCVLGTCSNNDQKLGNIQRFIFGNGMAL